jgi:hypothetical protein
MYCHVMQYAERLSSSNTIVCPQCMIAGHFWFQCSHTYNESLVSYNNGDATSEVLEYVLYESAHEVVRIIIVLMMREDSFHLNLSYETIHCIVNCCQEHLVIMHF